MATEERSERQSSITVARNAKGEFSFQVKIYFDEGKTDFVKVNRKIEKAYNDLTKRFEKKRKLVRR